MHVKPKSAYLLPCDKFTLLTLLNDLAIYNRRSRYITLVSSLVHRCIKSMKQFAAMPLNRKT